MEYLRTSCCFLREPIRLWWQFIQGFSWTTFIAYLPMLMTAQWIYTWQSPFPCWWLFLCSISIMPYPYQISLPELLWSWLLSIVWDIQWPWQMVQTAGNLFYPCSVYYQCPCHVLDRSVDRCTKILDVLAPAVFLLLLNFVWRFAVKKYASASSWDDGILTENNRRHNTVLIIWGYLKSYEITGRGYPHVPFRLKLRRIFCVQKVFGSLYREGKVRGEKQWLKKMEKNKKSCWQGITAVVI